MSHRGPHWHLALKDRVRLYRYQLAQQGLCVRCAKDNDRSCGPDCIRRRTGLGRCHRKNAAGQTCASACSECSAVQRQLYHKRTKLRKLKAPKSSALARVIRQAKVRLGRGMPLNEVLTEFAWDILATRRQLEERRTW